MNTPPLVYINAWQLIEIFYSGDLLQSQYLAEWPFECGVITFLYLLLNFTILQSVIYISIHILGSCFEQITCSRY